MPAIDSIVFRFAYYWQGALLAFSYFVLAQLGLNFTVVALNVTLVWPPSGLAFFCLLTLGLHYWPWVLLAAFFTNFTTDIPVATAIMIAVGNSLEAVIGVLLLRWSQFKKELQGLRDIMLLTLLVAGCSTIISASFGAFSLAFYNVIHWEEFSHAWVSWWMGDAMGILVVTPLLLSWRYAEKEAFNALRIIEVCALMCALLLLTEFVFGTQLFISTRPLPLAFMTFPILIWAAMRFGLRGATTSVIVVVAVILVNIVNQQGLFAQGSAIESLMLLWLYANFLSLTSMVLAASVNDRREAEKRLRYQSQHDYLTGLPNRAHLQEDTNHALARAARHDYQVMVLFIDLDRFKTINDTLGHSVGDQLLIKVGQRLLACIRQEDEVYRHGGDEFVILLENLRYSLQARRVAEKIQATINQPIHIQGIVLHTSASIGISSYPNDAKNFEQLMKNADIAMYRAKEQGGNDVAFFSSEMNERALQKLNMEIGLRDALNLQQFELYFQPQISIESATIKSCEALLRWRQGSRHCITPSVFVPMLEETGLIKQVGAWVIDQACAQLSQWHASGWINLRMSVNISSYQLEDPELLSHIEHSLRRYHIPAKCLELEITESALVSRSKATLRNLKHLVNRGVRLAIDDFGTGYSSLSYLHRMSIDTLKIDRGFVDNIPGDSDSVAITRAIVGLGKSLHLNLVAEGVELQEQADFLRNLGCQFLQGYLYSPPLTAEEFEQRLRREAVTSFTGFSSSG